MYIPLQFLIKGFLLQYPYVSIFPIHTHILIFICIYFLFDICTHPCLSIHVLLETSYSSIFLNMRSYASILTCQCYINENIKRKKKKKKYNKYMNKIDKVKYH